MNRLLFILGTRYRRFWLWLLFLVLLGLGPASAQLPLQFQTTGAGAIPLVNSTTGTTGQITATLTGGANQWTYVCGFVVTSAGTTTPVGVNVTITGTIQQLNFTYNFVSSGQGIIGVNFSPSCISSSTLSTAIVLTVPAGGTGTTVAATIWGYRS